MSNYNLINPSIQGNLENTFSGTNQLDAAVDAWDSLSKYITNTVPRFAFTLENTNDGQLHHFLVKENLSGGNSATYKITELDLNMKPSDVKAFKARINKFKKSQAGGKKRKDKDEKDDDDDSTTSSSEAYSALKLYKQATKPLPIHYWWYDPIVYRFDSFYVPTFVSPLTPYIEVINYYA